MYFTYYLRECDDLCVGVIMANSEEEAREIAIRHLNNEDVEIEKTDFTEDGFMEVFYGC